MTVACRTYRICPQLVNWIKDFLGQRQQQVVLNGVTSEQCEVIFGVPQGTVLDPYYLLVLSMTYQL